MSADDSDKCWLKYKNIKFDDSSSDGLRHGGCTYFFFELWFQATGAISPWKRYSIL